MTDLANMVNSELSMLLHKLHGGWQKIWNFLFLKGVIFLYRNVLLGLIVKVIRAMMFYVRVGCT